MKRNALCDLSIAVMDSYIIEIIMILLQRTSLQQHQREQTSTASVMCPAGWSVPCGRSSTLEAAFLTMLTYTSPFVFASPVSCDAASEISSATEDAASDAAAQHQAAVFQPWCLLNDDA